MCQNFNGSEENSVWNLGKLIIIIRTLSRAWMKWETKTILRKDTKKRKESWHIKIIPVVCRLVMFSFAFSLHRFLSKIICDSLLKIIMLFFTIINNLTIFYCLCPWFTISLLSIDFISFFSSPSSASTSSLMKGKTNHESSCRIDVQEMSVVLTRTNIKLIFDLLLKT